MAAGVLQAQCLPQASTTPADQHIQQLFHQQNWSQVVRLAQAMPVRTADVNFEYGMALAHLGRLAAAHRALLAGQSACPRQKRFPIELGGIAFEQKNNAEAARWLRRAVRLDPSDAYANNFLATVYFLAGNLSAALKYWNRAQKPYIVSLDLDPRLRVHRLLLDRAFVLSPAAVLRQSQLATTQARLDGLGIFPAYSIHLDARPGGTFNVVFRAQEQDGFGPSRLAALLSTFAGAPYETLYPSYFNIGRSAMNVDSLLRWDDQKRRAFLSLSAPLAALPQHRWQIAADLRDENWAIRRSFTGIAPVLGSLSLERQALTANLTSFTSGRLQWSLGGELSHRTFRNVIDGSALTPSLVTPGFVLQQLASVNARLLDVPQRRFTLDTSASSAFARTLNTPSHAFEKLQGSALAHWFPPFQGDGYELRQQLRAGRIFGMSPFDELFLLGMDRDDTDLRMRAHIATRDGRKGSAPIGNAYILSNTDFYRRIYTNGLLTLHAGPLLDIGRIAAPTTGLSTRRWLFDTGIEARITVLHTSIVLSYGRDLRSGANAFYGTAAPTTPLP